MILICGGDGLLHGGADGTCVLFHGGDDENAHLHCGYHTLPFFWKMHVVAPGLESVSFATLGLESVSLVVPLENVSLVVLGLSVSLAALGLESVSLAALVLESVSLEILILIFGVAGWPWIVI